MKISGDVYRNPGWLREHYQEKGLTVPEIAEKAGVSRAAIRKWMGRYGIETTGPGLTPENTAYRDAEWLAFMYHERGKTVYEIADHCDVAIGTISRWLNKHDVGTRSPGFSEGEPNPMQQPGAAEEHPIAGLKGEEHPSYIGEEGGWRKRHPWTTVRKQAIKRDGERCILCGVSRDEHRDTIGQDLDVHHIVPTSKGGPKYDPDNLATLCRTCHEETHNARNTTHDPPDESDWPTPETAVYST